MVAPQKNTRAGIARWLLLAALAMPATAWSAAPQPGPPLSARRLTGPIVLDGNLDDAGWKDVAPITQWYETRLTDNTEPTVKNAAWIAYDEHYLYAGFQFEDPAPGLVRAPLGDHDNLSGYTDYGGVIVDSRNDGRTAQMFLANARGLQYDALSSDVSGEDNAPDYFWDAAGKLTETGWNLELRIPFSTLRYADPANPTFGLLLYRNYPRDRHQQFFSARLPRDVNCFICNSSKLTGFANLPKGSHLVVAPYATAERNDQLNGALGDPLTSGDGSADGGVDIKWNPFANGAIDATFNPDFSQVESDAGQITANERFALFYPEKRAFFLEGVDLFSTPFSAVYTRTVTSPSVGLRGTGRAGKTAWTALVAHDRGGGVVILPGPQGSNFAEQDFRSDVGIVRMRHEIGQSFVSLLGTVREIDDGGFNRVAGPDFQWRPRPSDTFSGQALWSRSDTPVRTDLATEWDGRTLEDRSFLLNYQHSDAHFDLFVQGQDLGPDFRADNGFIPQVGYREVYFESGWTFRPKDRFLSRIRPFTVEWWDETPDGQVLSRRASVGAGVDGRLNSFVRLELNQDDILVGNELLSRFRPRLQVQTSPGKFLNSITLDSFFGEEIDFDNGREGTGVTLAGTLTLRPGSHLELADRTSVRWLDVDAGGGNEGRLFTAWVQRLRATYMFNSRCFLRLIGQYEETTRDPSLYLFAIAAKNARFSGSGLFAYKVNWQTVFYLGYSDDHRYTDLTGQLEPYTQGAFAKISYAWQR